MTAIILTVLNEAIEIENLLISLTGQTKQPDEVIIVDGGSTDDTVAKINRFMTAHPDCPITLLVAPGTNISQGRNMAITRARGQIIAGTDGGCQPAHDWFEKITAPFELDAGIDIVAGYFQPLAHNYFEKCEGLLLTPAQKQAQKPGFIPSSRSIAFKKSWWEKIGGYPADLYTAEDTVFVKKMLKAGARMAFAPEAIVSWRQRKNLTGFARQVYLYAQGDAAARLWKRSHLRPVVNIALLAISVWIHQVLVLYLLFFLLSLARLRHRFQISNLYLVPGVIGLRFLQEIFEICGLVVGILRG